MPDRQESEPPDRHSCCNKSCQDRENIEITGQGPRHLRHVHDTADRRDGKRAPQPFNCDGAARLRHQDHDRDESPWPV